MALVQVASDVQLSIETIDGVFPQDTFFIHGNLASNNWWHPSIEIWKQQARGKGYTGRAFLAEFRGNGKSSIPQSEDEVSMPIFASDFIQAVQKLTSSKVNLVGHSTGGLIAALMMAQKPELFEKAVLLDPVGAQGVQFDDSMTQAFEQMKVDRDLVRVVMASTIYQNKSTMLFEKVLVEDAFHAVKTVGLWVLKALKGADFRSQLAKVSQPVLVLHGEHDLLLPIADSQEMAKIFPRGVFAKVVGQGHCTNIENPEKFVALVNKFLFEV